MSPLLVYLLIVVALTALVGLPLWLLLRRKADPAGGPTEKHRLGTRKVSVPAGSRSINDVAISLDGLNALLVIQIERTRIDRSGVEYSVLLQSDDGSERTVELRVPPDWPRALGSFLHKWNLAIEDALSILTVAAVGHWMDHSAPQGSTLGLSEISEALSPTARPLSYSEIQSYLEAKIYWNWKFRRPVTQVSDSDLIRTSSSREDFNEVVRLATEELWRRDEDGALKPTRELLERVEARIGEHVDTDGWLGRRELSVVLIADIADSTAIAHESEDQALVLIGEMEESAKRVVPKCGGVIVKFTGDGVLARFPSVNGALEAARDLVREFEGSAMRSDQPTALRQAIHLGEVFVAADGDLHGDVVNTSHRMQREARAGQVVLSEDAWRQVRRRDDISWVEIGSRKLKGISDPVRLFEIEL